MNKSKTIFLSVSLASITLFLIGSFYWFEWRPVEVRQICISEFRKKAKIADNRPLNAAIYEPELIPNVGGITDYYSYIQLKGGLKTPDEINAFYNECLIKHRVKPETLF
ncbi:MAG: hypothetical protein WD187_03095 [Candidatus Woykebacteria bacterium]